MKRAAAFVFVLLIPASAYACEPIVPLALLFVPWTMAGVWLAAAVAVKCVLFAMLQREMSVVRAIAAMFVANLVSSVVGVFAAIPFAAPTAALFGLLIVFAITLPPAHRLRSLTSRAPRLSGGVIAAIVCALYILTVVLFMAAQSLAMERPGAGYWLMKLAYVMVALFISMALTTLWEEWIIWRMSDASSGALLVPVFRANAVALFLIMLVAAIAVLPRRLAAPDHLLSILHFAPLLTFQ